MWQREMSATCGEAVWSGPRPWGIWPAAAGPALPFGSRECGLSHLPASGLGVSLCLKAWGPSKYLGWKCSFSFAHSFEPAPLSTPPRPGGWELPIQAWGFSDSDGPDPVRAGGLAFFASVFIFCIAHCSSPYPPAQLGQFFLWREALIELSPCISPLKLCRGRRQGEPAN